jgi:hypothetical protein
MVAAAQLQIPQKAIAGGKIRREWTTGIHRPARGEYVADAASVGKGKFVGRLRATGAGLLKVVISVLRAEVCALTTRAALR